MSDPCRAAPDTTTSTITIDDLVRRAQLGAAALSGDAKSVAYLVVWGDPLSNRIQFQIRVRDTQEPASVKNVAEYSLSPGKAMGGNGGLLPGAGGLRWITDSELSYVLDRENSKSELKIWNKSTGNIATIAMHDEIEFSAATGSCNSEDPGVAIKTFDYAEGPPPLDQGPFDFSWHMKDDNVFINPFQNPKLDKWGTEQTWRLRTNGTRPVMVLEGKADRWLKQPRAGLSHYWSRFDKPDGWKEGGHSAMATAYTFQEIMSPSCKNSVASREYNLDLDRPYESYSAFSLALKRDGVVRDMFPPVSDHGMFRVLGWDKSGDHVYYLETTPDEVTVWSIDLAGKKKEILRSSDSLLPPGVSIGGDSSQAMSADHRFLLLSRSSSAIPEGLVLLDLNSEEIRELDPLNSRFREVSAPRTRTMLLGDGVWATYFYPVDYAPGKRYPMVITQYVCRGFGESVGDEIPILPLSAAGISVLCLNNPDTNQASPRDGSWSEGNLEAEISRVERPIGAMRRAISALSAEGVVDPQRVALSGLSYGAEVAIYAWWHSDLFRAVSTASGSWNRSMLPLEGPNQINYFRETGTPGLFDEQSWKRLDAAMNVHSGMPPLLLQTGSAEEFDTEPQWAALRAQGVAVDWYEYPNEGHEKVGPANKWWVFTRNLDWFRFWLQDYQDPDPAKKDEYAAWRALRDQKP